MRKLLDLVVGLETRERFAILRAILVARDRRLLGFTGLLLMSAACSDVAIPGASIDPVRSAAPSIDECAISADNTSACGVQATVDPFLHQSSLNEPIYTGPITVTFDAPITQVSIRGQGAVWCLGDIGTLVGYDPAGAEVEREPLTMIDPSDCGEDEVTFGGAATLTTMTPLRKVVILPPNPFQFQFTLGGTVFDANTTADYTLSFAPVSGPDLIARTIHWNAGGDGVDFTYEVTGHDLQNDTTVGLFWATGPTQADILGPAFSQAADRTVGTHRVHASASQIAAAPQQATHLLSVVDHDDTIVDEDPSNNQVALRLPHIAVIAPPDTTVFRITAEPAMPSITVGLNGVPATLVQALSVRWHTEISSGPGDFPHQIATFSATPIDATVTGNDRYQPDFQTQLIGGKLTFTAGFSVAGVPLQASSKDRKLRILGTQPDAATIQAYVGTKPAPGSFPAGGGFAYTDVLLRIMQQETSGLQFRAGGAPVFNRHDDGGAGLFQITPPSTAHVWNWKANADAGAVKLNDKLGEADGWIDSRAVHEAVKQVRQQFPKLGKAPVRVDPPPWSRDVMVLREGVQRYNGGNAFRARGQVVTLADGTTVIEVTWERTGRVYHEQVLGPLTP